MTGNENGGRSSLAVRTASAVRNCVWPLMAIAGLLMMAANTWQLADMRSLNGAAASLAPQPDPISQDEELKFHQDVVVKLSDLEKDVVDIKKAVCATATDKIGSYPECLITP
jgi:hypothetical protein